MVAGGGEVAREKRGIAKRLGVGLLYFTVASLALVGLIELLLEMYSWHIGARWRPEEVNALLAAESPTMKTARAAWEDFKYLIQYGAYLIAAIALLLAVAQIKTVSKLMSDYLDARGAIYQLAATMTNAEEMARRLSGQADRMSRLEPTIQEMSEKIEEAMLKLGDLQRQTVSERIEASEPEPTAAPVNHRSAVETVAVEDTRWEKLRELWNANGARLDLAIERIPDKRKRTKYSRMDRRNYPAIINGLADEKFITETARKGSLDLHGTFTRFRPRNREVPAEVVGAMLNLDRMLEEEFNRCIPPDTTAAAPRRRPADVVENHEGQPA